MPDINPATSITAFNVTGLNNPITRQRLSNWIRKISSNHKLSTRDTVYIKDKNKSK